MRYQLLQEDSETIRVQFEKDDFLSLEGKLKSRQTLRLQEGQKMVTVSGEMDSAFDLLMNKAKFLLPWAASFDSELPVDFESESRSFKSSHWFESLSHKELKELGHEFVARLQKEFPDLATDLTLAREHRNIRLKSSSGKVSEYGFDCLSISNVITGCSDEDIFFWGQDYQGMPESYEDIEFFIDSLVQELQFTRSISEIDAGEYPFIFHPALIQSQLMKVVEAGFNPANLENGSSPLLNKEGQQLLHNSINVYQTSEHVPTDLYGVPSVKRSYFEDGVLKTIPVSVKSSKVMGREANGANYPSGFFSDLIFQGGDKGLEEMIASIDEGVLLIISGDLFMGQILYGDMRGTIQGGLHIKDGKIQGRVKDRSLGFNFYNALNEDLRGISKETRQWGTAHKEEYPYLLVDGVQVS